MHARILRTILLSMLLMVLPISARSGADPDVLRATLQNGLRVVIVRNDLAPVVSIVVNYLVGSNDAPEGFPGMAHAQEHMLFRGSPGLSSAQLAHVMALMGGEFNAETQQTVTQYYFSVPADLLDVALEVEAVRMRDVLDAEDLWDLERGAIMQEVAQDLSSPEYVFYTKLLGAMFPNTPYAHDALGTEDSFKKTTNGMLKQFYEQWYAPNNAVLVIVGDVEPGSTLAMVRKMFGAIPKRVLPKRTDFILPPPKAAEFAMDTDLPNSLAIVSYRLPGFDSRDFVAGQILADVLDSRRSNLYALVPEGKALSTSFDNGSLPKASYAFATAAYPAGSDGKPLVAAIKGIMAAYARNGVPADLVEAAKQREIADAETTKNSVSGLAAAWSQAIAIGGRTSPDDDIIAVRKVTVEDVNRVAREFLRNETAITAMLSSKPVSGAMEWKGNRGKESFSPKEVKPVELPSWASRLIAVPRPAASKVKPVRYQLANGITLIVQPETVSSAVTLVGRVRNNDDLQEPEGKEGVSDLMNSLFSYGTTSQDRLTFQRAQDDIVAEISAGTAFSLKVLSDRFERGVQLLADNLLRPALPEQAFQIVKDGMKSALQGQLESPDYRSKRALREALYPKNDPVQRDPTLASISALTLKEVKAYHAKALRPDMTTIVVVGKVAPERARAAIERSFGAWKAEGQAPQTELPEVPPNKSAASSIMDASRVQEQVTLAETLGITRQHPDYYPLQLGNHILSGAFYASRLSRDLRENAGLVYTVESFIEAGKYRSVFGVVYACDPVNVNKARAVIEHDLRDLQTVPVPQHELVRAKTMLIRQVPLAESSMDGIAVGLLAAAVADLPLDEQTRAANRFRDISAEDVRMAFARWIRPDEFVQVSVGPDPKNHQQR